LIELMLTIAPPPAASRYGSAARLVTDGAEEPELKHSLPFGVLDFQKPGPRTGCAEVVDEYVDLAVTFDGGVDQRAGTVSCT
jgi:hypothetical protein